MKLNNHLPSPKDIKKTFMLSEKNKNFISKAREMAKNIFLKKEKRKVIILGPCSIHEESVAIDYAKKIKSLPEYLKDKFFFIMRFYCEKPRSSFGWKGFFYDPSLDGSNDLLSGIIKVRKLLLQITELEIPCATEFLDPILSRYIEDLITWGMIGARTSLSQLHWQLASSLAFPIGIKNPINGNIFSLLGAAISASNPHTFPSIQENGVLGIFTSTGNKFIHLVLRGSLTSPNYDPKYIESILTLMKDKNIFFPLLIDCSHDNSKKDEKNQIKVFNSILEQDNDSIIGLMLESNLFRGKQSLINPYVLKYGISVTDSCLDWEMTKELLNLAYEKSFNSN